MSALVALWHLHLRLLVTPGRLVGLGALASLGVLAGLAIGAGDVPDTRDAAAALVSAHSLGLLAPVVTLVLASAALGDLVDDRSLVHVWLRPVPRGTLAAAALTAALTVALPLVLGPVVVAVALTGAGAAVVGAAAAASAVAVVAYGGVFLALGLVVRRALAWGLLYVVIWEGFVASAGGGAARVALRSYTRGVLGQLAGVDLGAPLPSLAAALAVPVAAGALATAWTARRLARMDVP